MKADIDQWLSDEIAEIEGDIEYFRAGLMPFLLSQIEGTKKKSIKLPSGKIGFRAGTVQYFIGSDKVDKDNQTLIDFAKSSAPEFVKTKETLDWAGFKKQLTPLENGKVVTKDGEIIENMWVVKNEDKFYVEVIKEAAI